MTQKLSFTNASFTNDTATSLMHPWSISRKLEEKKSRNDAALDAQEAPAEEQAEEEQANLPNPRAQAILNQCLWDTGDAIQYFGARDVEVSAKDAIIERIARPQTQDYQQQLAGSM